MSCPIVTASVCCGCSAFGYLLTGWNRLIQGVGSQFSNITDSGLSNDTVCKKITRIAAELFRIASVGAWGVGAGLFAVSLWEAPAAAGVIAALGVGCNIALPFFLLSVGTATASRCLQLCGGPLPDLFK